MPTLTEQARHRSRPTASRRVSSPATRSSDNTNLNAQVSKGFRLGGINDPLNVPLCTPEDLVTFGGRDTWKDETAWNYEVGSKSRIMGGRGSFNVSAFYMDINDLQATVTAGSCSSRVIFNVPKARSTGVEVEFAVAPNEHFDFAISASYNDSKLQVDRHLHRHRRHRQRRRRASRRGTACRPCRSSSSRRPPPTSGT